MKKKTLAIMTAVLLMAVFFMGCAKKTDGSVYDVSESSISQSAAAGIEETSEKPEDIPVISTEVRVGYVYSDADCDAMLIKDAVQMLMAVSSTPFSVTVIDASGVSYDDWILEIENADCDIVFLSGFEKDVAEYAANTHANIKFELYGETGDMAEKNLTGFYFRIYQQQYLNGMAAAYASESGNIGYISETAESEDLRRVNAFALGAKAANPNSAVHFIWTAGVYSNERDAAYELAEEGCDLIFKARIDETLLTYSKENNILLIGGCEDEYVYAAFRLDAMKYVLERARASVSNKTVPEREDSWIGLSELEADYIDYDFLEDYQLNEIKETAADIAGGKWDVFTGPITDVYGNTIIPEGVIIPDEDLMYMLWYVENVKAISPPMG